MDLIAKDKHYTMYFKYLNCLVDNPIFMNTMKACWERELEGNVMCKFYHKLKRLANTLNKWSKQEFVRYILKGQEI